MKKIIVTGGYGFIGRNLINYLIRKKFYVINVDKLTYSSSRYNSKSFDKKNYNFFRLDINDRLKFSKILKKYKPVAIYNIAAETHVDRSIDDPKNFISSNILGVFNLLESVRGYIKKTKKKIKFIHISTDEVYGDLEKSSIRSNEKSSYKPSSPYAATKASADHLIKSYIRTYNFPAIISNCCNNYGPYQFPEKLIPKIITHILSNKIIPIYGRGKNSREWIYVDDHCEALFTLYLKGKLGESYNIGSNKNLENIYLAKKILSIFKMKKIRIGKNVKIKFVKDRPGHDFKYALNSYKIYKKLNWKAKVSIDNGLSKTIDWYLDNQNFLSKIPKSKYVNRLGLKL